MADYRFKISPIPVSELELFRDASAEELRVLIAIQDRAGMFSDSDIIGLTGVSKARFLSALALWQEAGAIIPVLSGDENCIVDEFATDFISEDFYEESAKEIAKEIRDNSLREMMEECSRMLHKSELSALEMKLLVALNSQYALIPEYILLLASYLSEKGCFTVFKLFNRAKNLSNNGVETVDELEEYIKRSERAKTLHSQIKNLFGIFNRNLNKKEKDYLTKWTEEYGYDIPIITAAFDMLPAGAQMSFGYIDKILADWHENKCSTVAECEQRHRIYLKEKESSKEAAPVARAARAHKKTTPRYGDFDPDEAFRRALARTYGESGSEDKK